MTNSHNIKALISLLTETDPKIYAHLKAALFEMGETAIPYLDEAQKESDDIKFQNLLSEITKELNLDILYNQLHHWFHKKNADMLEGFYIVSKFQYPSLIFQNFKDTLNKINIELWVELSTEMTALEKIKTLNKFFFHKLNFKSDYKNPSLMSNMYLNTLLETKVGSDISLGILYCYLAQKQKMHVFGVNLPVNFILCYTKPTPDPQMEDILFYINPFNEGAIFDYIELENYFKSSMWHFRKENARPVHSQEIIHRLLKGLENTYHNIKDSEKVRGIQLLLKIFE